MHARRAALAALVVFACAYLRVRTPPPLLGDASVPGAPHALTTADVPDSIDELRARIAAILEKERVPGAAIALVGRDGPIWVGGIGVRDRETGAPIDGDTVFRVGSLSKCIVALGVMRLVDQGKLDIDRPLREILPGVVDNPWEDVAPVTLAQLMEHTAGIDDVRFTEVFTDDEQVSVRDTLALNPRSRVVRWRPGTRHAYSNVGFTIAARAIEVASGEPFDVYLRREILAPLGIHDADFHRTAVLAPRLATGYTEQDRAATFHPFAHRPSASLLMSVSDLAKLVQFWLRRGEGFPPIVSPAGLARIERSGTLPYPRLDTAYGFANYGDVMHPVFGRGHDGGMPGFHSSIRYFPELGGGYAMLLNSAYSFRGYFEIRSLLYAYLARGHSVTPPPAAAHVERPGSDYFALASPRAVLFEFMDTVLIGWNATETADGVRLGELGGESIDLVPTPDGAYRHPEECGSSVRFTTNLHGTPVMVMSYLYGEAASGWLSRARYTAIKIALWLIKIAPLWAAAVMLLSAMRRRHIVPPGLVAWPAIASLSCAAFMPVLISAFDHGVVGRIHPLTIAICVLTTIFPVASVASLVSAVRWSVRPDRPPWVVRLIPSACALAQVSIALWFTVNGLIAFRTWTW